MINHQADINRALHKEGVRLAAPVSNRHAEIITPAALRFVATLSRHFDSRRLHLLRNRRIRHRAIDNGDYPDFLDSTVDIRNTEWKVASIPIDLVDRRVEIVAPVDRETVIDALNSGANTYVADFEDANAPTWLNNVQGQLNLRDAVNGHIAHTCSNGRQLVLGRDLSTLVVRPRGWHLNEKHLMIDGRHVSAAIFDFALYFFHNGRTLIDRNGSAPYFCLPKLENHLEARLWNDVFNTAQDAMGIRRGTIRATVMIETILASFEMDEILYELREHSSGLTCGYGDYIFSFVKRFRYEPHFVLPDRSLVTVNRHFLNAYLRLLIETCHRRGIHAIGGMASQIPITSDPLANAAARHRVREHKLHEVKLGLDGTRVAHPGLVSVANEIFAEQTNKTNRIFEVSDSISVCADDLLAVPAGDVTDNGLRSNVNVAILYLEAWLSGNGRVRIRNLLADANTAELSRAQVWQWIHHRTTLSDGRVVTPAMVRETISEELARMRQNIGETRYKSGRFDTAAALFERMVTSDDFPEFMSLAAYDQLQ